MSTARKKLSNRTQRRIALNIAKQQSLSLRSEDVNEPNNKSLKRARTSSEFERLLDQDNSTTHEISLDCVPSSRDSEASEISLLTSNSEASEISLLSSDSEASEISLLSSDSEASEISLLSSDSEASEISLLSGDSEASGTLLSPSDSESSKTLLPHSDSEASDRETLLIHNSDLDERNSKCSEGTSTDSGEFLLDNYSSDSGTLFPELDLQSDLYDAASRSTISRPTQERSKSLYTESVVTEHQFNVVVASFAQRHNLTYECQTDMLRLMSAILPQPNCAMSTAKTLTRKFVHYEEQCIVHQCCGVCMCLLPKGVKCPRSECALQNAPDALFVEVSLEKQLQERFKGKP